MPFAKNSRFVPCCFQLLCDGALCDGKGVACLHVEHPTLEPELQRIPPGQKAPTSWSTYWLHICAQTRSEGGGGGGGEAVLVKYSVLKVFEGAFLLLTVLVQFDAFFRNGVDERGCILEVGVLTVSYILPSKLRKMSSKKER